MKHILFIGCISSILLFSCKKDVSIGAPVPIEADYKLPQGNASQEANDKIQQLYNKYGSYFLYSFTQKDFIWVQSTGSSASKVDTAVLGNPAYAGDMLNFLDDIWLKFLPDDFKKNQGIPYRVMMADTIKQYRPGFPPGREYLYSDYKVTGKAIAFAGMNSSLRTMTGAQKTAKKNIFISAIWNYYVSAKILDVPASFYTLSNYAPTAAPTLPLSNADNKEAYRQRGFIPGFDPVYLTTNEWYNGAYSWQTAKTNDLNSFVANLTMRTDAQMEPFLKYPLIKQKFDLLVNYYKTKYNIDVRAIANATY
ncbi:hypothetical protein [Chitinophaga arvensicola]|uniref:Uncharacterized protein n=1 Tax=Chitinophaga arvensicola TaxID=29529 RepID=A0A1I0R475_9BACT|nr:hypothetical protein [Chitinophaga arvensicola]SEW35221.1 hypothetical protein SAMN04488122_2200 [Chitinophaga arvensicola]